MVEGKSTLSENILIREALSKPNAFCAYVAPTFKQAKDVLWHSPDTSIKRFLEPIPDYEKWEQEARCQLPNGSIIRLFGSDEPDRLRGIGLDYVVIDEVSQMNPRTWSEIILPALSDKAGKALFIGTPKGHNFLYDIWETAGKDPENWYRRMFKASETGIIDPDILANLKAQMDEDTFNQEYECSFDAAIKGSYYGRLILDAENDGRIGNVPWNPEQFVYCVFDLGVDDSTAIWFYQKKVDGSVNIIDYEEDTGEGLPYYVKLVREKPYNIGMWYFPHDIVVKEFGSGKTRLQVLKELGITNYKIVPKTGINEGIDSVRRILPKCYFNKSKCEFGIEALKQYQKEYNDKLQKFADRPRHDWCCLTGDTKIRTLDGWYPIKDLVGKDFYVWSYNFEQKRLYPAKTNKCWKAKTVDRIVKITLDDGSEIKCTPDHPFLKRDEEYIEAQYLKPNDRLMPFYERSYNDYISVHLNDGTIAKEHEFVYSVFNGYTEDGFHIHHVDKNKNNNNPENLQKMTIVDHISLHSSEPERLKKLKQNGKKSKNRTKQTEFLVEMNKFRSGNNHHTKNPEYFTDELRDKIGEASKEAYKASEKIKECLGCGGMMKANWKRLYCCNNCKATSRRKKNGISSKMNWNYKHSPDCKLVENHKVVKVEFIDGVFDVYDISVPKFNNFVAEGVVLHNSHAADAFRYLAVSFKERSSIRKNRPTKAITDYDPFGRNERKDFIGRREFRM